MAGPPRESRVPEFPGGDSGRRLFETAWWEAMTEAVYAADWSGIEL